VTAQIKKIKAIIREMMSSLKSNENEIKKRYQNNLGADNQSFRKNNPHR
jgi:hypothetical protein